MNFAISLPSFLASEISDFTEASGNTELSRRSWSVKFNMQFGLVWPWSCLSCFLQHPCSTRNFWTLSTVVVQGASWIFFGPSGGSYSEASNFMSDFYLAAELQRVHFCKLMCSHFPFSYYNLHIKGILPSSIFTHGISDVSKISFAISGFISRW